MEISRVLTCEGLRRSNREAPLQSDWISQAPRPQSCLRSVWHIPAADAQHAGVFTFYITCNAQTHFAVAFDVYFSCTGEVRLSVNGIMQNPAGWSLSVRVLPVPARPPTDSEHAVMVIGGSKLPEGKVNVSEWLVNGRQPCDWLAVCCQLGLKSYGLIDSSGVQGFIFIKSYSIINEISSDSTLPDSQGCCERSLCIISDSRVKLESDSSSYRLNTCEIIHPSIHDSASLLWDSPSQEFLSVRGRCAHSFKDWQLLPRRRGETQDEGVRLEADRKSFWGGAEEGGDPCVGQSIYLQPPGDRQSNQDMCASPPRWNQI